MLVGCPSGEGDIPSVHSSRHVGYPSCWWDVHMVKGISHQSILHIMWDIPLVHSSYHVGYPSGEGDIPSVDS
jgi:hypothetical protein